MRADNYHHIVSAARRPSSHTAPSHRGTSPRWTMRDKRFRSMRWRGKRKVSRSWLYNQPDLRAEIERLRARTTSTCPATPSRPATRIRRIVAAATRGHGGTKSPTGERESATTRGARGRPRRTAHRLDRRPPRRHAERNRSQLSDPVDDHVGDTDHDVSQQVNATGNHRAEDNVRRVRSVASLRSIPNSWRHNKCSTADLTSAGRRLGKQPKASPSVAPTRSIARRSSRSSLSNNQSRR